MPRVKRFHLAQTLATEALGVATLAIAIAGQLPAQAVYGPPPPPPAPGGYTAVVTSVTVGPAGRQISVRVGVCLATLTIPPGTFKTPVQVTITAPTVQDIGDGGHPGFRAVCGVGILIQVNGKPYTGTFGHSLTLDISGVVIKPGARVAVWNGKRFVFVSAPVVTHTARISFTGSSEDFAVLVPGGGGRGRFGSSRGAVATGVHSSHGARTEVLTALFLAPFVTPAGIGVLAPEWLASISR
jgi:hypothetical protein